MKKNYYKPKFKIIQKLKNYNLTNLKILKFKKKKWSNYLFLLKNNFNTKTKYKKFKIVDLNKTILNKKDKFEFNFKSNFKKLFLRLKTFNIFFGKLKKSYYKKLNKILIKKLKFKNLNNIKNFFIKFLEKRLDFILFISKFCLSLRSAKKIINLNLVKINKKIVKSCSYILKTGDLIKLGYKFYSFLKKNLSYSIKWPVIPNYLQINYKTMEIIYLNNLMNNFFYPSYFNKIPQNFKFLNIHKCYQIIVIKKTQKEK